MKDDANLIGWDIGQSGKLLCLENKVRLQKCVE